MTVILGAGLAGLSTSYHLNHKCKIFEKQNHAGGHIYSEKINQFTWDEGPHVSFTKHEYVKELFALSLKNEYLEYPVYPTNYYKGNWIAHPAQTSLVDLPEPLRTQCFESFLSSRNDIVDGYTPKNYKEWLSMAFGNKFAEELPGIYTLKYWATPPENLTTDWVGERIYYPNVNEVKSGYHKSPVDSKHYITSVRYPKRGGYYSYANLLLNSADLRLNKDVKEIDLENKTLKFSDGTQQEYNKLINTIPLPEFILKTNPPEEIREAAEQLSCSELVLINVVVNHPPVKNNHWFYVYDQDKYSTRINYTDLLAPSNGVAGKSGLQVEVYFSKHRRQNKSVSELMELVSNELVEMGLVKNLESILEINTKVVKYANVIFDHQRRPALNKIFDYLEKFGMVRESDELEASTNWDKKLAIKEQLGDIILAGRFGQWKYYWTDDCVLRGLYISQSLALFN